MATDNDEYLNNRQAAGYIGYSPDTLKASRVKGELAGKAPPRHYKIGRSVRYKKSDLDKWVKGE